ncbi:protein HASTY 1 isoform X1 [Cucumis melo]|uniref:Protein HASTY 1 isoform X1 n=1 Tax=Cucumis melo TaxID=3656 RepID=A0A1S3C0Y8_CUCME|nr:protein HASTY 1 isoform X1 [Cucumis melo]
MDENTANNVAQAIAVSLDWSSSPDARKAALSYLESIKTGDVRILASTSLLLVTNKWSSEIRLHAYKTLQHLVRYRWEELNSMEKRKFANVCIDLMAEITSPCEEWALKSQSAALVAEIVRREGLSLWEELFPSLVSLSSKGPIHAELVSMMLRWLPEDITVHYEDLEGFSGDRRRILLRGLTQSLPEVFSLLYTLLERHFGAALNEVSSQRLDVAKQHAAAVTAALNAVNAYAEWAPLTDLAKYGIMRGCGFLLCSPDFRLHACEFFKLVSARKRSPDANTAEYDSAMRNIFEILMNISRQFFIRGPPSSGLGDESESEFMECICESLVSMGSSNLQCISGDSSLLPLYLQQMLGFFQHDKLALHFQSLHFWLALMRDLVSKLKVTTHSTGDLSKPNYQGSSSASPDNERRSILSFMNDDICTVILDISFKRLLKKEKVSTNMAPLLGGLELWSDDFDGKGDFSQYRSKLLELIKFLALYKPVITSDKVSERIITIIKSLSLLQMSSEDIAMLESMQSTLDNVVSTIFDEFGAGSSEIQLQLRGIFEGLIQQLLSLKWSEPALVIVLAHYLDALGPFLKYFPDAVASVINKLFELLTSLPIAIKDPSTRARLQICTSFIRIAKAADRSILPHMKGIADSMGYLQREGRLLRGEHNLLGEAFLVMASTAGIQQQHEILAWLLEPLSQQWIQPEWQNNYLSEPHGLVRLCSETSTMWSIFHTVTFFEKALKRSGTRKSNPNMPEYSTTSSPHPMTSHLSWMLPPLLKLLRSLHSLWFPAVSQTLPGEFNAAMTLSDTEKFSLLGEVNPKLSKGALSVTDDPHSDMSKGGGHSEPSETDIRNWLKCIRDSGYNVLGLSATVGESFYNCLDIHFVSLALMENVQSMEFRHLRQLVHAVIIPLVKGCPPHLWDVWLEKLLMPLIQHTQQCLNSSWSSLLHEGRANVPDVLGIPSKTDLKVEVMEEKLLRDLTREVCSLLAVMASSPLNPDLPSLEQSGHVNRAVLSSPKHLDEYSSSCMVGFLLKHKGLAISALRICLDAFTWTDGEAVAKISSFCSTLVLLAIATNDGELNEFVSRDLFSAIIQGLTLESNTFFSSDLVGLCREIFLFLSDRNPAPRQVLLSLPCIKHHDLVAFEEALAKTFSPKEQKQHMKNLLLLATGNQLKALAAQKSINTITNVSAKSRGSVSASETRLDEGDSIGLAAIL